MFYNHHHNQKQRICTSTCINTYIRTFLVNTHAHMDILWAWVSMGREDRVRVGDNCVGFRTWNYRYCWRGGGSDKGSALATRILLMVGLWGSSRPRINAPLPMPRTTPVSLSLSFIYWIQSTSDETHENNTYSLIRVFLFLFPQRVGLFLIPSIPCTTWHLASWLATPHSPSFLILSFFLKIS